MDFGWQAEQEEFYTRILRFARESLNATVQYRDKERVFGRAEWDLCGKFGLHGLCVPEVYGGSGLSMLSTARMVEAFGRGCEDMGLVFASSAHLFACVMPLLEFGSDSLKQALLPRLASGQLIGANAITEAEAGSDVFALRTRAERRGEDYVLNGVKSYVSNGPVADVVLVYAVTNPAFGYMGISAFMVSKGTPGMTVGQPFDKTGLSTCPTSSVYFEDCVVPCSNRVGAEGQGALAFKASMHWERACLFAGYLGAMERQLEQVVAYAKERKQFGHTIGSYQSIAHRIADMKLRLEAARLLLYRACWLRDQGETATLEVSLAKISISEAAIQGGLDAIRILGGNGIMREYDVERALRDALPSAIFSGTSEIQRNLVARELGL